MWPILFKIGNFEIGTFGLMVAIGFFASYTLALRSAVKAGYSEAMMSNFLILCLLMGLIGAKLLHVIVNFRNAPLEELLFSRRGLVYYGGLISGIAAGFFLVRRNKWSVLEIADLLAPAIPVGEFFGRIGCFLNGCCFGKVCSPWLGIRFPKLVEDGQIIGSDPFYHQMMQRLITPAEGQSLPVYPTQLLSSFSAMATFLFIWFWLKPRATFKGQVALTYLICYSGFRFLIEMLRDDPRGSWFGVVSTSQGISLGVFVFAAVGLFLAKQKAAPCRAE